MAKPSSGDHFGSEAEEAFRQSEERFRNLTLAAFEGIGITEGGKILDVNDQLARMLGYSREELIGQDVLMTIAPESRPLVEETMKSGIEGPYEHLGLRKDGTVFESEVRAKTISWGDRLVRVSAVRDITERKRAERQLRLSEERFELAVRGSADGLWDWNILTNDVFYSDRFRELLGYSECEFPNEFASFETHLHTDDRDGVLTAIKSHLRHRTPYDVEYRLRTKAGECRWFRARGQAIWNAQGLAARMAGSITDVTERRKAEDALRKQVAFDEVMTRVLARFATCSTPAIDTAVVSGLQAIAQFIGADHAYVVITDADQTSWSATHEWCASHVPPQFHNFQHVPFGVKPWSEAKVLAGETIRINTLEDYPQEALADRETHKKEGAISLLNVPIRGAAGRITGCVGLHAHSHPILWSDGDISCLRMIGNAIASLLERKRAEDSLLEVSHRLHRAQDAEGRRIARELHDSTAQHLAAVLMNLEMLKDLVSAPNGKITKLLKDSLSLVEKCSQEVRTFSYLLHPPLLDQIGLEAALRSYVEGFSRRSQIPVEVDLTLGPERFSEEVELTLFRVVQEALGNIHRHSGSPTALVRLARESTRITLAVSDLGKGIPPVTLEALRQGLLTQGVGLAAMQERLREVGGHLDVDSTSSGTCIRAMVPFAENGP